uniref:Aurora kinase n=1 Tax=Heterorhabditis bacteriophora TaxID=37862 RepID=A0A1I7XPW9_HETBA
MADVRASHCIDDKESRNRNGIRATQDSYKGARKNATTGSATVQHTNSTTSENNKVCASASSQSQENKRVSWVLDDFDIGRPLGKGKFGSVFLAREKNTKFVIALKNKGKLEEIEAAHYIRQLADIADFGWAVVSHDSKRETVCGTLDYLPPEMTSGKAHDHNVDNWAIGVLLYEMLVGKPPFECPDQLDTIERIKMCSFKLDFTDLHVCVCTITLLKVCVSLKKIQETLWFNCYPYYRIPLADVLTHPWILEMTKKTTSTTAGSNT